MSSKLNFKNNKKLTEYASAGGDISLAEYQLWGNDTRRYVRAAGGGYIMEMIDLVKMTHTGDIPRLVYQARDDEYTITSPAGIEFMQRVVSMASTFGKDFTDVNPAVEVFVKRNYKTVIAEIEDFGGQINSACPMDRKEIFNQRDIMHFPLCPLLEWHCLHCSFDIDLDTNPTAYQNTLDDVKSEPLSLGSDWINAWVARISNARADLLKVKPMAIVDDSLVGPIIHKFYEHDDDPPSKAGNRWQNKAEAWHDKFVDPNKRISWLELKKDLLTTAESFRTKRRHSDTAADVPRPAQRLHPAVPHRHQQESPYLQPYQTKCRKSRTTLHWRQLPWTAITDPASTAERQGTSRSIAKRGLLSSNNRATEVRDRHRCSHHSSTQDISISAGGN